ncbi:glycosyl transferase [Sporocytophaga myxococcoides]|uniref:Glycosyl transferase n=1 Tax=Sporocytophaga myxococcoides TaxID=153721 RepID=A0A098LI64_9BACT|nr:glycosyltransferase family 4 protein [Sporocytophaga myxococcoides]GAL86164.1 glycosyl transferase [Sporocytophaga myxococcoides]
MRIAQVSPLFESVPPKLYGGTERIVSYLTEELVKQGHEVTLFASGDSETKAKLIAPCNKALRLDSESMDPLAHHFTLMEMVQREVDNFDIIHFHIDYLHFPLSRRMLIPHVSTLHGRLDMPDLIPLYKEYKEIPVVSISDFQRKPLSEANWIETVYHGLPSNLYKGSYGEGKYLAFLGRFSPEKRPERAIQLAIDAGIPIKLAAKVDTKDHEYFETVIKPMLNHPLVEYVGEVSEKEKQEFLENAIALVFLIDWPEPFGLVMIESIACGTPVIAWRNGSVPEVIEDGVSGRIVESMEEALCSIEDVKKLDRAKVRACFDKRFSAERMAIDYLEVYDQLIKTKSMSNINFVYKNV